MLRVPPPQAAACPPSRCVRIPPASDGCLHAAISFEATPAGAGWQGAQAHHSWVSGGSCRLSTPSTRGGLSQVQQAAMAGLLAPCLPASWAWAWASTAASAASSRRKLELATPMPRLPAHRPPHNALTQCPIPRSRALPRGSWTRDAGEGTEARPSLPPSPSRPTRATGCTCKTRCYRFCAPTWQTPPAKVHPPAPLQSAGIDNCSKFFLQLGTTHSQDVPRC